MATPRNGLDPEALALRYYDPALCPGATQVVAGEGSIQASLVIVGEAPGGQEDKRGRPFVGPAGKLLDHLLADVEIKRQDVYITNAVKCRPTIEADGRLKNRPPRVSEIRHWQDCLRQELEAIHPQVILALGAVAGKALTGKELTLTKDRGRWLADQWLQLPLRLSFHPAYLLRQSGDAYRALYAETLADFQALKEKMR